MFCLEDMLQPRGSTEKAETTSGCDIAVALVLLALTAVLFPLWAGGELRGLLPREFVSMVLGELFSVNLLAAMAFAIALRVGAIDLSVWAVSCGSGIVAARLLVAGAGPELAVLAAACVGLGAGIVNGALVAWLRLPSIIITAIVALGVIFAGQLFVEGREVLLPAEAFSQWQLVQTVQVDPRDGESKIGADTLPPLQPEQAHQKIAVPLSVTQKLLVAGVFVAVMFIVLAGGAVADTGVRIGRRGSIFGALCMSGVLAGIAGALWLVDSGRAPAPTRVVDDFRVVAAALIAGAVVLSGRGRTFRVCMMLPPAVLLATLWRQNVWPARIGGYWLQLPALIAIVLTVHLSARQAKGRKGRHRLPPACAGVAALAALVLMGYSPAASSPAQRQLLQYAGAAAGACGAAALLWTAITSRKVKAVGSSDG